MRHAGTRDSISIWSLVPFLLMACEGAGPPIVVKVMTINVRHDVDFWEERFPLLADEIVRLEPDLIGLQEVRISVEQSRVLSALILARNPELRYEVHEELKSGLAALGGEGIAVMSRHPLVERDVRDLKYGRIALFDRIQIGDRTVDFFNTHLHHEGGDDVRRPQMEGVVELVAAHNAGHPTFLTGDMNTTPDSATIRVALDAGFVDTFLALHGENAGATFPIVLTKTATTQAPKWRIDYVFARGAKVLDAQIAFDRPNREGLYPSDHLGVVTTFEIE